ncbi:MULTISPECIES: hypothetical protein [unclassified Nocardia]|uniref:hypothetical protein n=1 Tax=unclassified Nocardia TaxID=2637762 RepID=UPI001CE4322C|nr:MULTISPECIES: hypothetical protein [unclassified Nocardia]
MTVRVGAVHLGWDVVSVAAGGGGTPVRPVQVEGTYTPPAYLLADSSGRLHTAGVDRQRPDLGMAIADVRDILGHPQIVVAGATWPAELVFRARMYNPLAAIGKYLRGKPDLVALPFPDAWPDEKVEVFAGLVEKLDVIVEPLPESVALSGYMRALSLVSAPDQRHPKGVGATGIYSDGRAMLVVAVHGDDEQPTESVDVPVTPEAMRDARSADNVVIEAMAAARSIGADTSTVLLAGNVCFNDPLRLAFQNHLGHRLQVADHPMHALVLGAAHLLVTDTDSVDPAGAYPESGAQQTVSPQQPVPPRPPQPAPPADPPASRPPVVTYGPGYPTVRPSAEPPVSEEPTTRVTRELPPNLAEFGSRFTRPPAQPGEPGSRPSAPPSGPLPSGAVPTGPPSGAVPTGQVPPLGPRGPYQAEQRPWGEPPSSAEDEGKRKGKRWKRMFGANAVIGAVALTGALLHDQQAAPQAQSVRLGGATVSTACPLTPRLRDQAHGGVAVVGDPAAPAPGCLPGADTLRYQVPGKPGTLDPGPPIVI